MQNIDKIRKVNPTLAKTIEERGGFILMIELPQLIDIDRHMLAMVRCGCGRFITPVDSVKHFINIIEKTDDEYVRDVSIMHNVAVQ